MDGSDLRRTARLVAGYTLYFLPFLAAYIAYESARGFVIRFRDVVFFGPLVSFGSKLFGAPLPLIVSARRSLFLDAVAGAVYAMHPLYFYLFSVYLLFKNRRMFERLVAAFMAASVVAIALYVVWPSAPPWIALPGVQRPPDFLIEFIDRITGVRVDPNPYAAMPSMHLTMATIFSYYYYQLVGDAVLPLSWVALMVFATTYTLNHYIADILAGVALGAASCVLSDRWLASRLTAPIYRRLEAIVEGRGRPGGG